MYTLIINFAGLRQRIATLFFQYCKTPLFNAEAAKHIKVPQDPAKLKSNTYYCRSCCQYLPSTDFELSTNSRWADVTAVYINICGTVNITVDVLLWYPFTDPPPPPHPPPSVIHACIIMTCVRNVPYNYAHLSKKKDNWCVFIANLVIVMQCDYVYLW